MITITSEQKESQLEQLKVHYKECLVASGDDNYEDMHMNDPSSYESLNTLEIAYDTNEMVLLQLGVITGPELENLRVGVEKELGLARLENGALLSLDDIEQELYYIHEEVRMIQENAGFLTNHVEGNNESFIDFIKENDKEGYALFTKLSKRQLALKEIEKELIPKQEEINQKKPLIYWDEMTASEKEPVVYWYEMTARPIGFSTQPSGWVDFSDEKGIYGLIAYDRLLTDKEMYDFELRGWQEKKEPEVGTVYELALAIQAQYGNDTGVVQWDNKGFMNHMKQNDPTAHQAFNLLKERYENDEGVKQVFSKDLSVEEQKLVKRRSNLDMER